MILSYTFFQHALLGGFLAAMLCAVIGTYVVTRRLVIAGGGMAHAGLGGVGLGAWLGISPLVGAAAFTLFSGFSIDFLSRRNIREDSAIAMLWTFGMAVGILFAYLTPGFMNDLSAYLFGDILSISRLDLYIIGGLTLLTYAFYLLLAPAIITVAYDRQFAVTQGLPVRLIERVMIALIALTIVVCLRMVGIVLVISLLSIPQQSAALFTHRFRSMVWLSALFGFAGIVGGLVVSYYLNVPSGATIILISVVLYFFCRMIRTIIR